MKNLKIRVNSEAESKEAQGLLEELGFKKFVWGTYSGYFIFANSSYYSRDDISNFSECDYKEITIPQLRDLVVLKRNDVESSQPEELPFIDDEPKVETATGYQLDVVGSNTYGSRSRYDGESDISYRQHLMNFIVGNRTKSLNDQYAEIEKVRQSHRTASETADPTIKETLSQRQAQYGDFKDVADTTEQLFKTIKDGNSFDDFTNDQRMALYMICSKMARIVNGNPNHKDSWHDIAGYATLIDNELVSEKDMPF